MKISKRGKAMDIEQLNQVNGGNYLENIVDADRFEQLANIKICEQNAAGPHILNENERRRLEDAFKKFGVKVFTFDPIEYENHYFLSIKAKDDTIISQEQAWDHIKAQLKK